MATVEARGVRRPRASPKERAKCLCIFNLPPCDTLDETEHFIRRV